MLRSSIVLALNMLETEKMLQFGRKHSSTWHGHSSARGWCFITLIEAQRLIEINVVNRMSLQKETRHSILQRYKTLFNELWPYTSWNLWETYVHMYKFLKKKKHFQLLYILQFKARNLEQWLKKVRPTFHAHNSRETMKDGARFLEKGKKMLAGLLSFSAVSMQLRYLTEKSSHRVVYQWIRACRAWIGLVREYHGEGHGFTISSRWASIYLRARGTRRVHASLSQVQRGVPLLHASIYSLLLPSRIHDKRKYIYNVLCSCNAANEWKPHRDWRNFFFFFLLFKVNESVIGETKNRWW